jgi:hypothetical protein
MPGFFILCLQHAFPFPLRFIAKQVSARQGKSSCRGLNTCRLSLRVITQSLFPSFQARHQASLFTIPELYFFFVSFCIIIPHIFCRNIRPSGLLFTGKGVYGFLTACKGQAASGFAKTLTHLNPTPLLP